MGRSLVAVFIPILLYTSGFSIKEIILYYLIYMILDVILNFFARESTIKFGVKTTVAFALIVELAYFMLLIFINHNMLYLFLLALGAAIYDCFFWVPKWFVLNECIYRKKNVGKELGFFSIIQKFASLLSPLVGGFILIFLNKNYLLFFVILIFLLSFIPFSKINLKKLKVKKKEKMFDYLKISANRNNFFMNNLMGIHYGIEEMFVPFFIFIAYSSIEKVSFIPVLASIGSIIFTLYISKLVDKKNPFSLIFIGSVLCALLWTLRVYFTEYSVLIITSIFLSLLIGLINFPIEARIVKLSDSKTLLDASMYRNIAYMAPLVVVYLVLYFSIEIFKFSFIIATFGMLLLTIFAIFAILQLKNTKLTN